MNRDEDFHPERKRSEIGATTTVMIENRSLLYSVENPLNRLRGTGAYISVVFDYRSDISGVNNKKI